MEAPTRRPKKPAISKNESPSNPADDILSIKRRTTAAETRSKTSPTNPNNSREESSSQPAPANHSSESQPQVNKLQ
ncbi:hypothetical protein Peur_004590 [Populus x canadensis]